MGMAKTTRQPCEKVRQDRSCRLSGDEAARSREWSIVVALPNRLSGNYGRYCTAALVYVRLPPVKHASWNSKTIPVTTLAAEAWFPGPRATVIGVNDCGSQRWIRSI
uniref:Uncharacterized protein n=1 Tax=Anopheles funestus TaxID=62324 RepID=A0A182RTU3_ANOFN